MRITKYRTELDQNKHNILVKESAVNYGVDSLSGTMMDEFGNDITVY